MAAQAVIDAVAARLAANWTATAIFNINEQSSPLPDGSTYLETQYPASTADMITIGSPGSNLWRERGVIRFVLNAQRGAGVEQVAAWCDTLAALFRGQDFSGVMTLAPSSPPLDDRNDTGSMFIVTVSVPYQYDFIG